MYLDHFEIVIFKKDQETINKQNKIHLEIFKEKRKTQNASINFRFRPIFKLIVNIFERGLMQPINLVKIKISKGCKEHLKMLK